MEDAALNIWQNLLYIPVTMSPPPPMPTRDRKVGTKAAPRLKELLWSERKGELIHPPHRESARKWLGLTKAEWVFFAGVTGGGFVAGLAVSQLWV